MESKIPESDIFIGPLGIDDIRMKTTIHQYKNKQTNKIKNSSDLKNYQRYDNQTHWVKWDFNVKIKKKTKSKSGRSGNDIEMVESQ